MSDYHEMTIADVMSGEELHEYEQAGEARLDALDEERWVEEAVRTAEKSGPSSNGQQQKGR